MKKFKFGRTHLACVLAFAGIVVFTVCIWYSKRYYAGIEEIIVTVTSPLKGSESTAVNQGFADCTPQAAVCTAFFILPAVLWRVSGITEKLQKAADSRGVKLNIRKTAQNVYLCTGALILAAGLFYLNGYFGITDYFLRRTQSTSIYEEYYIDPSCVKITKEGKGRNLILIYLESMETGYASADAGGSQDTNYIPNLTRLAEDEVNFSENGLLGGYRNTLGSTWTAGSLFSSTTALPFPAGKSANNSEDCFMPGVTGLYDILDRHGYDQYFLCGSDAYFGGRSVYYKTHGNLTVYDHSTAISDGYIDENYHQWWGYEDSILYDIAKDKITKASKSFHPFSFTMITADTHFPQGYVCSSCRDDYPSDGENVVSCADRQIADFIAWCKTQDFYADTTIVVMGDHPRMDKIMPRETPAAERKSYICFVNCADKSANDIPRTYTQLDIMPTTLAAMGFEIEGDRLGLGTNLFSSRPTIAETEGFEKLNSELGKSSRRADEIFGRVTGAAMLETILQTLPFFPSGR